MRLKRRGLDLHWRLWFGSPRASEGMRVQRSQLWAVMPRMAQMMVWTQAGRGA